MSKVELTKNGRTVRVDRRLADHLTSRASYGYMRRDMVAGPAAVATSDGDDRLANLRAQYQEVVGKRAYHGWSADELQQKIAAHRE